MAVPEVAGAVPSSTTPPSPPAAALPSPPAAGMPTCSTAARLTELNIRLPGATCSSVRTVEVAPTLASHPSSPPRPALAPPRRLPGRPPRPKTQLREGDGVETPCEGDGSVYPNQDENGSGSPQQPPAEVPDDLQLDDTLSDFFSKGGPVVNSFLLLSFVGKTLYHHEFPIGFVCSIIYLACLIVSLFIDMVMIRGCSILSDHSRCKIAYLSTILRMSAAAALLPFLLDTVLTLVMLLLSLLVLGLVAYFSWQTFHTRVGDRTPATWIGRNLNYEKHELKLRFGMSAQVVSMAFGGLGGEVLGNVKGSSNLTGGVMSLVVAPECLLFYSAVLSLLVVLLCTVPPRIWNRRKKELMATVYIPIMANAALSFLVLASVFAAQGIVQEYHVVFVCFAVGVVVALMFYCCVKYHASSRRAAYQPVDPHIRSGRYSQYIVPAYFTSLFATLMVSRSMYGTASGSTVPLSWSFQGFVLSAVCSILSYAIHAALLAEMRDDTRRWEIPRKMASYVTYATTAAAIVFVILFCFLQPDEVKSIF